MTDLDRGVFVHVLKQSSRKIYGPGGAAKIIGPRATTLVDRHLVARTREHRGYAADLRYVVRHREKVAIELSNACSGPVRRSIRESTASCWRIELGWAFV